MIVKTDLEYYHININAEFNGEYKKWRRGELTWHLYYANDELIHDFLVNPLSDEERMLLVLKYGAPVLPKEKV